MSAVRTQVTRDQPCLTIHQFAKRCGVSEVTVRRVQRQGIFGPAHVGEKGRGHQSLYSLDQVEEFKRIYEDLNVGSQSYTGTEAQRCFQAFRDGKSVRDCVLEFGLHPDVVELLSAKWEMLAGHVRISRAALAEIEGLGPDGPCTVSTEDDVLEVVRLAVGETTCRVCEKGSKDVCGGCVEKLRREMRALKKAFADLEVKYKNARRAASGLPPHA